MDEEKARLAENYHRLATLAAERFNSRRDVEWKTAIGIWTLFGAGAVGIVTARNWGAHGWPWGWMLLLFGLVIAIVILYLYWQWHNYIGEAMRRDQLIGFYWESGIQDLLDRPIPNHLEPGFFFKPPESNLWVKMPKEHGPSATAPTGWSQEALQKFHTSQKCQIGIAIAFAFLFVVALATRCLQSSSETQEQSASRVLFEGDVQMDATSGLKIGKGNK